MRRRVVTREQVEKVLRSYHASYPAVPLPGRSERSIIYVGRVDGRDLKVYVLAGSDPPYVKTVAWLGRADPL